MTSHPIQRVASNCISVPAHAVVQWPPKLARREIYTMCVHFASSRSRQESLEVLEDMLDAYRQASSAWAELTLLLRTSKTASKHQHQKLSFECDELVDEIVASAEYIRALGLKYRENC
jgi:hypothetical protein